MSKSIVMDKISDHESLRSNKFGDTNTIEFGTSP